jgi:hypothetical protein
MGASVCVATRIRDLGAIGFGYPLRSMRALSPAPAGARAETG